MSALNVAYDTTERRGILGFQLVGLLMTLCAVAAATVAIAVLVFLPAVIAFVGLSRYSAALDQHLQHRDCWSCSWAARLPCCTAMDHHAGRRRISGFFQAQSWRPRFG